MKRALELAISLFAFTMGLPIIFLIIVIDLLITQQFPLFVQIRSLASESKEIKIIKIKTIIDCPANMKNNPKDSRKMMYPELEGKVPGFCRWLRKSGIDEFFQLINVIKGEMSIVGPRPLVKGELKTIKKEFPLLHKRRLNLKLPAGITGYWQIYGEREGGFENLVELDEYYKNNKSLYLDLKIILKTFYVMLTANHSDAIIRSKDKTKFLKIIPAD